MPHTLVQLKRRTTALKAQASAEEELIEQIRARVVELELCPKDIFPDGWPSFDVAPDGRGEEIPANAKYADGPGRAWSGIGRRPKWLNAAIGLGAELDDFLVKKAHHHVPKTARSRQPLMQVAEAGVVYRGAEGQEWSGVGRRPKMASRRARGGQHARRLRYPEAQQR